MSDAIQKDKERKKVGERVWVGYVRLGDQRKSLWGTAIWGETKVTRKREPSKEDEET